MITYRLALFKAPAAKIPWVQKKYFDTVQSFMSLIRHLVLIPDQSAVHLSIFICVLDAGISRIKFHLIVVMHKIRQKK